MKKRFSILEGFAIGIGALGIGAIGGIIAGVITCSKANNDKKNQMYRIDTTIQPVTVGDLTIPRVKALNVSKRAQQNNKI